MLFRVLVGVMVIHLMICGMNCWRFYVTNKKYTWTAAVENPPCHIVGMNQESRDLYMQLFNKQIGMPINGVFWTYGYQQVIRYWYFTENTCYIQFKTIIGEPDVAFDTNTRQECATYCRNSQSFVVTYRGCYCGAYYTYSQLGACTSKPCPGSGNDQCGHDIDATYTCACMTLQESKVTVEWVPYCGLEPCYCESVSFDSINVIRQTSLCTEQFPVLCYESEIIQPIRSNPCNTRTNAVASETTTTTIPISTPDNVSNTTIQSVTSSSYANVTLLDTMDRGNNTSKSLTDSNVEVYFTQVHVILIVCFVVTFTLLAVVGVVLLRRRHRKMTDEHGKVHLQNIIENQENSLEYDEVDLNKQQGSIMGNGDERKAYVESTEIKKDDDPIGDSVDLVSDVGHGDNNKSESRDGVNRSTHYNILHEEFSEKEENTANDFSNSTDGQYNKLYININRLSKDHKIDQYHHITFSEGSYQTLDSSSNITETLTTDPSQYDTMVEIQRNTNP